jgi:hypothetical protein
MDGVTSGEAVGMSGVSRRWSHPGPWRAGYLTAVGVFVLACAVNVLSKLHDLHAVPAWRPVTWEVTSTVSSLAFLWIIFAAVDASVTRRLGWWRTALLHSGCACLFSALHCMGMWTLRRLVYTVAGVAYGWSVPPGQVFYEFRKDVVTYAVTALISHGVRRMVQAPPDAAALPKPAGPSAAAEAGALTYDIRDGARLWRVPVSGILAVASAGNYVEFLLAGGEKRLMRGTLAGVLADLAPAGFIRVHRSWLVNQHAVRALEPESSGDYRLTLTGNQQIPLSRRFRSAVAAVRNTGAPARAAKEGSASF